VFLNRRGKVSHRKGKKRGKKGKCAQTSSGRGENRTIQLRKGEHNPRIPKWGGRRSSEKKGEKKKVNDFNIVRGESLYRRWGRVASCKRETLGDSAGGKKKLRKGFSTGKTQNRNPL